jgi:hypothetical protein
LHNSCGLKPQRVRALGANWASAAGACVAGEADRPPAPDTRHDRVADHYEREWNARRLGLCENELSS